MTSESFKEFVLDSLSPLPVSFKKMMGEYLLYVDGLLIGGLYDDRLLLKKSKALEILSLPSAIPYPGAKEMFHFEDVDDAEKIKTAVWTAYDGLKK